MFAVDVVVVFMLPRFCGPRFVAVAVGAESPVSMEARSAAGDRIPALQRCSCHRERGLCAVRCYNGCAWQMRSTQTPFVPGNVHIGLVCQNRLGESAMARVLLMGALLLLLLLDGIRRRCNHRIIFLPECL